MQIVSFSEFSRRRGALDRPAIPAAAGPALPLADRWAQLHSESAEIERASAEIVELDAEADFWSDLQFRIAYPTHRLRRH